MHCMAQAASRHPDVLTYRRGNKLVTFRDADIGSAADSRLADGRRIARAITLRSAQSKSLARISHELRSMTQSNGHDDPTVKLRRRMTRMPWVVRRLVSRHIGRDPYWLQRFHGTIGLTNLAHPGLNAAFYALPPNIFTVTVALGSVRRSFCCNDSGAPVLRQVLSIAMGIDHAVVDGAAITSFGASLANNLRLGIGLDSAFAEELRGLRQDAA